MNKEKIDELLKKFSGRIIDLCYEIVDGIQENDFAEQVDIVGYFCETFGTVKSEKTLEISSHISDETLENLKELYGKFVDELLEATLKKAYNMGMDNSSFYQLLWGNIVKADMFGDVEEKSFALYYIVIDRRIPYFLLEKGMWMDDDTFKKCREKNLDVIKKMRFILFNSFSQKTEEASIILDEIVGLDSYEDQVVVLASILGILRQEQKRVYDAIREMVEQISE